MIQKTIPSSTNSLNLSFHQKSTLLSLIITSSATAYYFANAWPMQPIAEANGLMPEGFGRLILNTVIVIILSQIVLQIVLAFGAGSTPAATAHEKTAALKATRNAHLVLTLTVFTAVASFWSDMIPFYTADLLVIGFALSEIIKFASQLFYARR